MMRLCLETKIKDEIENDQGEIFEEVLVKVEFNENTSKEADDLAHQVKEELKETEEEDSTEEEGEDDFSKDDVEDQRFRGSYMLGQFLKELLNKEFDRRCEKQRKKAKSFKTRIRGGNLAFPLKSVTMMSFVQIHGPLCLKMILRVHPLFLIKLRCIETNA